MALFVWSQNFLDSMETLSLHQLEQSSQQTPSVDDSVNQFDDNPHNLVMVYFACLVGRRDLLPSRGQLESQKTSASTDRIPGPLRCRLSRLLESTTAIYAAFNCYGSTEEMRGETVGFSRHELNLKKRLVTPHLKRYF